MYKSRLTMLRAVIVATFILTLPGCVTTTTDNAIYEGIQDPTYELSNSQAIGLTELPVKWLAQHEKDSMLLKQILAQCKAELEKRGFAVSWIGSENIKMVDEETGECHLQGLASYPDLTLTVDYEIIQGSYTVPAKSSSSYHESQNPYDAWAASTSNSKGAYDVSYWNVAVAACLWAGPPEYMQQVWRGTIIQSYDHYPILADLSETLVRKLFLNKFPILNM